MAAGEMPKLLDADALMDEIIAKKGPREYKEGLSEENWEEVSYRHLVHTPMPSVLTPTMGVKVRGQDDGQDEGSR